MYDSGKIIILLVIFLVLVSFPIWYQSGKAAAVAPEPQLTEIAKKAGKCIESKEFMKTHHMKMLDQWRNEVVRDGERYYTSTEGKVYYKSLQVTCMECHSNKSKFCDQCHNYAGVYPFCWDCHIAPKENM
jgi:cytochrome c